MTPYLELLRYILKNGREREDRTGTGTKSIFGAQMRFDLRDGFPLLTTKKLHVKSIVHELLWFLRGETNVAALQAAGVRIWDPWATPEQTARFGRRAGDLGPVYGHQWRNHGASVRRRRGAGPDFYDSDGVDQIANVIDQIRNNPTSRRLIVSSWNVKEAEEVALPPCHTMFQFHVDDGDLSLQLYQRSGDMFLGVPFNIASYALLLSMVAQVTGLRPGYFIHTLGDAHIYLNHIAHAEEQLLREPRTLPKLQLNRDILNIDWFSFDDVKFIGYDPHPSIAASVSV